MQPSNRIVTHQILADLNRGDYAAATQKVNAPRQPKLMIKDFVAVHEFRQQLRFFNNIPVFKITDSNKAKLFQGIEGSVLPQVIASDGDDLKDRWEFAKANSLNSIQLTFWAQNIRYYFTKPRELEIFDQRFFSTNVDALNEDEFQRKLAAYQSTIRVRSTRGKNVVRVDRENLLESAM